MSKGKEKKKCKGLRNSSINLRTKFSHNPVWSKGGNIIKWHQFNSQIDKHAVNAKGPHLLTQISLYVSSPPPKTCHHRINPISFYLSHQVVYTW